MENVTEVYDCSASDTVFVKSENASCDPPLWVASFQEGDVDKMENSGEEYDGGGLQKKRRLKPEQVQFLEKSFELENKLEPERKAQLAKEAGLQPRQVAIWFQNRRARYKTKLLEKDYTCLKASYEKLKADYVKLFQENEEMRNEIKSLTGKAGVGEKRETKEEKSDQISPLEKAAEEVTPAAASSDVVDSDSVHCGDSEEYSQEEEDETPCKVLLHHPFFPKLELESHDDLQPNCCNLGFPVQKQGTWFWHY